MTANPSNLSSSIGLRPGDKIDKYEVVQQIGAGGFSLVWKAHDRLLDKHVAIKQVTNDSTVDEDTFRERFRAEAVIQKKAADDHKHLVRVIDFVEDPRGLFIVMEYVDGPSLEHLLAQNPGPVEVNTALGIAAAAAVGLGAIHEKGIVHRDLKPANILLPKGGGLKICDFGLASLMVDQETPAVGTVRYMAPELINAQTVDGRADIYSLGMVLYEMLLGRANFDDAFKIVLRDQRNVALRWMKWHTNLKVKAPPIRQYVPTVPEPIAQLVERMMEKDAGQRIANAPQLLDAMRRQLAAPATVSPAAGNGKGGHAVATAGAVGDKTVKIEKKSKLVLIAAVTVILWTIIGIGYLVYTKNQANDKIEAARQLVYLDYSNATKEFGEASRGEGSWADASVAFRKLLDKHTDHLALPVPVYDNRRRPLEEAAQAHLLFCDARTAFAIRDFEKAIALLNKAEDYGSVDPKVIRQLSGEAVSLRSMDEMRVKILKEVEARNFFGSILLWREFKSNFFDSLSDEQKNTWNDLLTQVMVLQEKHDSDKVIAEATGIAENDPTAAVAYLEDYLAQNPDKSNRLVVNELNRYKNALMFDNELARGKDAERRGDFKLARDSYENAIKHNRVKSEELGLPSALRKIKARILYEDAMAAATDSERLDLLQAASGEWPEMPEVKRALLAIESKDQRESLRRQAVLAKDAGDYLKAINLFKRLRDEFQDETAAAEITGAELAIAIAAMERAWSEGDDDAALKAIDEVLVKDSSNERANTLKNLIETRRRIRKLIENGNALSEKGQYGDAKREIRRAQEIARGIEHADVRDQLLGQATSALDEVEYRDAFSKAKRDLELGNLDTARAWALTAVKAKPTVEARALLTRIEAAIAEKGAR